MSYGAVALRSPVASDAMPFFEFTADAMSNPEAPSLFGLELTEANELMPFRRPLRHGNDVWHAPMVKKRNHWLLEIPKYSALLTENEPLKLHKQFGRPESSKLHSLLKRAGERCARGRFGCFETDREALRAMPESIKGAKKARGGNAK